MIIKTRVDDEILLSGNEAEVLQRVQGLLRSRPQEFRQAFVSALTDEVCPDCGAWQPCYCGDWGDR